MGPARKLTEEQISQIMSQYAEGVPIFAIAKNMGIPNTTARTALARKGIPVNPQLAKPRTTKEQQAQVIALCTAERKTTKEASEILNISTATIERILRKYHIKRPMGPRPQG